MFRGTGWNYRRDERRDDRRAGAVDAMTFVGRRCAREGRCWALGVIAGRAATTAIDTIIRGYDVGHWMARIRPNVESGRIGHVYWIFFGVGVRLASNLR